MAVFNEPPNSTRFYEIGQYMNDITNGTFWTWMTVAIFFIILLRLQHVTTGKNAISAAGFITFLLAGLLAFSGLIGWGTIMILSVVTIVGMIYMFVHEDIKF